jgi:multisubunit Na+/H+ antiporter MnhC subunit
MRELFSTLVLVVSAAILALVFLAGGAWVVITPAAWKVLFFFEISGMAIVLLSILAGGCIWVAAVGGRQHPVFDGLSIVMVLGVVTSISLYAASFGHRSFVLETLWTACMSALVCTCPAWFITYLALRRTPLLRGLAPERVARSQ